MRRHPLPTSLNWLLTNIFNSNPQSQEELDAHFARQLYMEDQEQQAAWQAQQQQQRPRPTFSGRRDSYPQPAQEKDTMTEISDQFNKIAESLS